MNFNEIQQLESSQIGNTDERLSLGCHEMVHMGLIEQGPESGGSNETKSSAMYHTYEVSLVNPGKELLGAWKHSYNSSK